MCVVYFWYSGSKEHQMSDQSNKPVVRNQSVLEARQGLFDEMAVEGFVPGTQKAYARAYDRFAEALKGLHPGEATVKDAKAYLAELKRAGATRRRECWFEC